jgi:adenosylcobinamide-GDP ribazoletransferase
MIKSLVIAFSMYSKIPMPKVDWNNENMKYIMCFFPLIGIVIGATVFTWYYLSGKMPISQVLSTSVMILIPVVITGGIHMDGLLDTADALSSYQSKEKRLEILKDPHAGAFAVIIAIGYAILTFGIWYDITPLSLKIIVIGFVLSRALSGLAVVTFPLAKGSGLVSLFSDQAKKSTTKKVMIFYCMLCVSAMLWLNWRLGLIGVISATLVFGYYRYILTKKFGGITGDLAGFFLQICELAIAIGVIMGDKLCG